MLVSPYFSETLLDLYRKAQAMPVTAFSPFAIDTIKKFIDFDSAMFGLLSRRDCGEVSGHYMYVHNEDPVVGPEWRALAARDPILRLMLNNLGQSFSCQATSVLTAPEDAPLLDYVRRRGHLNVLSMALPYGAGMLRFAISLRRADELHTYNRDEELALELLLPHISEAFRINQTVLSQKAVQPGHDRQGGICIFDNNGTIVYSDESFSTFAKAEFDDYEGYTLPSRLKEEFCDHRRSQLTVGGVQVQIVKIGYFHFLSIRTPCRLAVLTERELAIARFYGTGLSNKEIAAELEISPLTVRKHIEAVYTKLRINNKADLAYLIHASAGAPMLEKLVANFAVGSALG